MNRNLKQMHALPVNESVVFSSPLEGKDILVRTGTIPDGACFFHALLHACSDEYVMLDEDDRSEYVKSLRRELADQLTYDTWKDLGDGVVSDVMFQRRVNDILNNLYAFVNGDVKVHDDTRRVIQETFKADADAQCYQVLTELIPVKKGFEDVILPAAFKDTVDGQDAGDRIYAEAVAYLDANPYFRVISGKSADYMRARLRRMVRAVADHAGLAAYAQYKSKLAEVDRPIDTYTLSFLSNHFKRDVYFIDADTRLPYNSRFAVDTHKRTSVIVLWVDKNHYEIVGRLCNGNRVQREFNAKDELVYKIRMVLYHPEQVEDAYPELIPSTNDVTPPSPAT